MVEIFVERRPGGVGPSSEEDAFADLYNRTYNPLVAYCRRYCPPGYDPEDIAQEALSRAWSSWDRYSQSRPFWPWVATIARRLCVDYWRRDERAVARAGGAAALEPCTQPRPDELSEAADECRMAVNAFRRLRPDHQRIVGLRDIEGWSYEDIARFEGVTVESIRGSLRRARMSLRKSYDSLAKGGVPALAPLALLVRLFEKARARFGLRMARWQTTLNDTGVASTRLGEALVSLMAVAVAVVGVGTPSASVVRTDATSAADTAGALGSTADAGAVAGGNGAASGNAAANAAGSAASGTPAVWANGRDIVEPGALPVAPTDPGQAVIFNFTPSPNYAKDGTIFAAGTPRGACPVVCGVLFKSTDRGITWQPLSAGLMNATKVLLPPAYPRDNRIFATGAVGFQVSTDGGRSFVTLTPSSGTAVMSPAFSNGDPRVLLPDSIGWQYNDETKVPEPLGLMPGPNSTSSGLSFGFLSDYHPANPVMFVGASMPDGSSQEGTVARCLGTNCSPAVVLSGMVGTPRITVTHGPQGDVVYAVQGAKVFRSVDQAGTFQEVGLPEGATGMLSETAGPGGRLYVVAANPSAKRGDMWSLDPASTTWARVLDNGMPVGNLKTVQALPDGTLLAGLNGEVSGIACSRDGGASWAPHC
jgi:RNA polymerase sigma-70 factor (ECF subfamily)